MKDGWVKKQSDSTLHKRIEELESYRLSSIGMLYPTELSDSIMACWNELERRDKIEKGNGIERAIVRKLRQAGVV